MLFVSCEVLRCLPPPRPCRDSVLSGAHSSNTENCLNMFICEAYKACWTGIPEKCFHLPTWHWSTAVDVPILIWSLPCFGESKPSSLWSGAEIARLKNIMECMELLFVFVFFSTSSQSPMRPATKENWFVLIFFFQTIWPTFENAFIWTWNVAFHTHLYCYPVGSSLLKWH